MESGNRIVIFTGGSIETYALKAIRPSDTIVGADRGAYFLIQNGIQPHVALGDFDSVTAAEKEEIEQKSLQFISCDPVVKDWTDTEMAMDWALNKKPAEIILFGALGTRFDHSLANVQLLLACMNKGVSCKIIDANNQISITDRYIEIRKENYPYISILPLSMEVSGITLKGFKYPLKDAQLVMGQTLGISNELTDEIGRISVKQGILLIIQSKDF